MTESTEKVSDKVGKIPFPKSVPYVVVIVFFERFSTGGILGEFKLNSKIEFDEDFLTFQQFWLSS